MSNQSRRHGDTQDLAKEVLPNYIREKAVLVPNLAVTPAKEWLQLDTNSWAEEK